MYICFQGRLMKKLQILLDDDLYGRLKKSAALRRESLADVIRLFLRERLDKELDAGAIPILGPAEIQELLRLMDSKEFASADTPKGNPAS